MRSKITFMIAVAALVAGCGASFQLAFPKRGAPAQTKPAEVIGSAEAEAPAEAAPSPPEVPPDRLMEQLKKQEAAAEKSKADAKAAAKPAKESEAADAHELTTDYLVSLFEKKQSLTPAEQTAYGRLVAVTPSAPPQAAQEYKLLGQAQEAVAKGDFEGARSKAKDALAIIRTKTDPSIDRVFFATNVRNYGDADAVDSPSFSPGQQVLLVTDISDFNCQPVGSSSPPAAYSVKMSQRVAIYDTEGRLKFQKSYDSFEYQAAQYFTTMFIPRKFALPSDVKAGQYVVKVELTDLLAGRQTETSVSFSIK